MLVLVQTHVIKILENHDSPGILPFKLGVANIVTNKHVFLYNINLKVLGAEIKNLNEIYKIYIRFNSSLNVDDNAYFHNIQINYEHE